jgi:hypothetical protein
MSVETAKSRLNKQPTDPAEGWIEPSRVQTSYDDLQDGWRTDIAATVLDTGWRNMAAAINADWELNPGVGVLRIRRIGQIVFVAGNIRRVTPSGGKPISVVLTMPVGFTTSIYTAYGVAVGNGGSFGVGYITGHLSSFAQTNFLEVGFASESGEYTGGESVMFETSYAVISAWPNPYPGTPYVVRDDNSITRNDDLIRQYG